MDRMRMNGLYGKWDGLMDDEWMDDQMDEWVYIGGGWMDR